MVSNNVIIGGVTFVLFFGEAILHYNVGLNGNRQRGEPYKFGFPAGRALFEVVCILLIFCIADALVTSYFIERAEGHAVGDPEPGPNQPRHLHYTISPLFPQTTPDEYGREAPHVHLP